jgi:hypothetical protein
MSCPTVMLKVDKTSPELVFWCTVNDTEVALRLQWYGENHASCRFNKHDETSKDALQGKCMSDPVHQDLGLSGPGDLVSRTSEQGVFVTDISFLRAEQNLWLDNLYIRFRATNRTQQSSLVDCFGFTCNLWLTSVTMQGNKYVVITLSSGNVLTEGDPEMGALAVVGGQLYAEGVCFRLQCVPVGRGHKRPIEWLVCGTSDWQTSILEAFVQG